MRKLNVCVIGLGYIGLPTAAVLANHGFNVNGCDVSEGVVKTINSGGVHVIEPGLEQAVKSAVRMGNLSASIKPRKSDVYIICVPTPIKEHDGLGVVPDVSHIDSAVKEIARLLKPGDLIILESTSPVGTTRRINKQLENSGVNTGEISIACCPERVIPGRVLVEIVTNSRIVGGLTETATKKAALFYKSFVDGAVLETNADTAEMAKLTENSFRDVNIAFANELSIICQSKKIDVLELIDLANHHPRVNILSPGPGVGGHCIAVDPWFIVDMDRENSQLIRTGRLVNKYKENWVFEQIKAAGGKLASDSDRAVSVACLGLSFKPDIDDLRESPAVNIARLLRDQGFEVTCVEPNIEAHDEFDLIQLGEALNKDLIVGLVRHKEFIQDSVKASLGSRYVLDFCGILR